MARQVSTDVTVMKNHLLSIGHQHPNSTNSHERDRSSPPIMTDQHHERHCRWSHVNQTDYVRDLEDGDLISNYIEPDARLHGNSSGEMETSRHDQTRYTRRVENEANCATSHGQRASVSNYCNQEATQSSNHHQVTTAPDHHNHRHHTTSHIETHASRCHPNITIHESTNDISMGLLLRKKNRTHSITLDLPHRVLTTLFVYAILNHLSNSQQHDIHHQSRTIFDKAQQQVSRIFPSPITVVAALVYQAENTFECRLDNDCEDPNRICHESRCICKRNRPIDDRGTCLPLAVVGELCSLNDQCLGNSACIEGTCACGSNTISLYNPSAKIFYCHPKRGLRGECSQDAQCPSNAFCSTDKYGCLCQNGYGTVTVKSPTGVESSECLPKTCSASRDCESEFHSCEENRCICMATHFDPHTAECYKFGSTGGIVDGVDQMTRPGGGSRNGTASRVIDRASDNNGASGNGFFTKTVKDLIRNSSDISVWLIVILLSVSTLLLLTLMIMIVRKYYLGYCWTAHKKEYEPNNDNGEKSQAAFSKNSINNKSFRKKTNADRETDDDDDDDDDDGNDHHDHNGSADNDTAAADKSQLVTTPTTKTRTTTTTITSVKTAGKPNGTSNGIDKKLANGNVRVAPKLSAHDGNQYVSVDMSAVTNNGGDNRLLKNGHDFATTNSYHQQQQLLLNRPLASSTSTPV